MALPVGRLDSLVHLAVELLDGAASGPDAQEREECVHEAGDGAARHGQADAERSLHVLKITLSDVAGMFGERIACHCRTDA